jgi:hypothetical protein
MNSTVPTRLVPALLCCLGVALAGGSAAATAAPPANPCLERAKRAVLNCPDLQMSKPFGLRIDPFVRPGHVMLRAGNSINSRGRGPAELFGVRSSRMMMKARQRIYRRKGGRLGISTGARLYFKYVPGAGRGSYWKFLHAAQFDLYRLTSAGKRGRHVRRGPKVSYCLRDLDHSKAGLPRSPGHRVYPACNQSSRTRKVKLGTSVGWSDVYPPGYPEQYIDVTGLRGCFLYRQEADPRNGVYESDEANNASSVVIRLPFKPGSQHCSGARSAALPDTRDRGEQYELDGYGR